MQALVEAVHFDWRHAKNLCALAHSQENMHSNEAANHGDMFRAPMLVNVIEQFIAARAANIDIDVRAIAALLVQEALEVESPVQRADARNADTIRHHGTGGGARRDCGNTGAASFLH